MKKITTYYKTVSGNEGDKCHYPTRLDLYGCGCQHDCSYCYAKSLLSFRGLWNPKHPKVANQGSIHRTCRKVPQGGIVRLGGMTDCFQPLEKNCPATYNAIRYLNKRNIGYLIVTKSALVASPEYLSVMRKDLAHIQITVTSTDDAFAKTYEKASAPSERIRAIETLHKEGFDVALRLSPFIPQFIGRYLDLEKINNINCDKIVVEFLRVNNWIKNWFDIDYTEYKLNEGGYWHLPLRKKVAYLQQIGNGKQITVCEDVTRHYDYWRENVNPNKEDCYNLRLK